jgi:putative DNA methylase
LKKKLIEVALPLEAINTASAREKSIRHGHPSTLHLWWARRPLAAARAVIFAQMVDDPSSHPERFPTGEAQEQERQRLFRLIEELVLWENTTNETVLAQARDEIWKSWRTTCVENRDHPRAKELFDPEKLPAFHDPFAGGGSLPLEAQRLGLEAYASDLNPVAVLINKAMIEIPPKFAGRPPVNPKARAKLDHSKGWRGAQGLASISTVREKTNIAGLGRRNHAKPRRSDFPPNQGIGVG